jgi:Tfp pilus assembly protein PilV
VESQPDHPDGGDTAPVGWQGPDVGLPGYPPAGYPPGGYAPGPYRPPGDPSAGGAGAADVGGLAPLPGPAGGVGADMAPPHGYEPAPRPRRGRGWAAMVLLLAVALCGLAGGAAGVVRQLLPRQFSAAQQRQIMAWEMTRRWRAMPVGQIFPATVGYQVAARAFYTSQPLSLTATRLGIAPQGTCAAAVSKPAAAVLAAGHCAAMLRATYIDASGSMLITLGVAVLPASAAAHAAAQQLSIAGRRHPVLRPLAVAGTPAASFRENQRQLSVAISGGPYVILVTAGFSDGRPHLRLTTDNYYSQEMAGLVSGLAQAAASRLGAPPPVPRCPGAPGC